jgi:heme/copper-type cytochrome/quinol oxidase subunit 3
VERCNSRSYFFWNLFKASLSPTIQVGVKWPPHGISPMNPFTIPLANTLLLITSGYTLTWAHHALVAGKRWDVLTAFLVTLVFAVAFTGFQVMEYREAGFDISDSIYGAVFYLLTGFHGFHVLIGTIFLIVCAIRHYEYHFTKEHHIGFESAAWYWHFVDVVWIIVFIFIYIWGSWSAL